jgi:hypothetical protein
MGVNMTEIEKTLRAIAEQIVADVDSAVKTNDLELFLDRMVANAEDLQAALTTSPQRVAQNPLHTNERKQNGIHS